MSNTTAASAVKTPAAKVASPKAPTAKVAPKTPVAEVAPAKKVETPAPAPRFCACGCGAHTVRPEARYVAGHDARHAGQVGRSLADTPRSDADLLAILGTTDLVAKARRVAATAARKVAEKEARRVAKEAAKVAYAAALVAK